MMTTGADPLPPPLNRMSISKQQQHTMTPIADHCSHAHGRKLMKLYVAGSKIRGRLKGSPFQHAGLGLGLGPGLGLGELI